MVIGTVFPFSAISGRSSLIRPCSGVFPPAKVLINSSASFLASAVVGNPPTAAAAAPTPRTSACRRLT
jgi:hypothetical protein